MDSYKKHQLKIWWKKKRVKVISSGGFLLGGIIALIVGFKIAGNDILAWFKGPYAITCYIVLGVAFLVLMYEIVTLIQVHLGIKDDSNDIFNKK